MSQFFFFFFLYISIASTTETVEFVIIIYLWRPKTQKSVLEVEDVWPKNGIWAQRYIEIKSESVTRGKEMFMAVLSLSLSLFFFFQVNGHIYTLWNMAVVAKQAAIVKKKHDSRPLLVPLWLECSQVWMAVGQEQSLTLIAYFILRLRKNTKRFLFVWDESSWKQRSLRE